MAQLDARIDAYIAESAAFARPILTHLRALVHEACPEVEEGLKWRMPHFMYRGGILCSMAAFKQHCSFGLWHGVDVLGEAGKDSSMGQFGRITSLQDLPDSAQLVDYLRQAMALREAGVKQRKPKAPPRPAPDVPEDLRAALAASPAARAHFERFPPSHQREYVEWIIEAKRPETRTRRLAQTLEWLAEGKPRHWKHMNC